LGRLYYNSHIREYARKLKLDGLSNYSIARKFGMSEHFIRCSCDNSIKTKLLEYRKKNKVFVKKQNKIYYLKNKNNPKKIGYKEK